VSYLRADNAPRYVFVFFLLGTVSSTAQADPIAGYTVTNLGSGPITLSTSNGGTVPVDFGGTFYGYYGGSYSSLTNGAPVVSVSNGQATYAFAFTPDTFLAQNQANMSNFPLGVAAPVNSSDTYGNPAYAYSFVSYALMNSKGMVAAVDIAGVDGHWSRGTAYTVQQNAGGSWGWPTTLWSATGDGTGDRTSGGTSIVGINNLNQVLGTTGDNNGNPNTVLYDLTTHTLTNFLNLIDAAGNAYIGIKPYAIDDQGRILSQGNAFPSGVEDTLLLTPVGVSADPLQVPAPEPGSLAVMALAMAGFAAHRIRERRRRR
jgi:PEP-CTERM motif-containing protein